MGSDLEVQGLSCAHDGRAVLEDVSLRVTEGGRVAVVGRSGAGKTTLLRAIAGLIAPTQGKVLLGGREASRPGAVVVPPQERGIGFVFQGLALWPHLTVSQTLRFAGAEPERVSALAAQVGLGARLGALPAELSGGERQRLALARALTRDPALLLLDEPFAHQDPPLRRELIGLLLELVRARGTALLLVTHEAEDAFDLAREVVVLHAGRAVESGPLERAVRAPAHPETVALLGLGTVLAGERRGDRLLTALGELALEGEGARAWVRLDQVAARPQAGATATVRACAPRREGWRVVARLADGTEVVASAEREVEPGSAVALEVSGAARSI